MRPVDFWSSTPHEINTLQEWYIKEQEAREKTELSNTMILAWNIANFSNAKKLPDLKNIIKNIFKKKKETPKSKKMSREEIEEHYNKKVVR